LNINKSGSNDIDLVGPDRKSSTWIVRC